MSQTIKLKRSSVAGKVPTTGNLDLGEIALNTNDGKVFFKKNDGTDSIQTILTTDAEITGNLHLSGSLTASSALIGPLTFPIVDGSENQFIKTDGNGNLSFVDGVRFPYTGSAIISSSLQVTGSSSVTGSFSLNDYSLPEIDGDDGQVIMTNGEGTLVFNDVIKYVTVKNIETVTLPKGTPVHATSSVGNTVEVVAASASLARTMPATFVLNESLDPDQEGRAILTGFINGVNTSGFNEGDVVYVGESGGYTNVKPTGTNLIQNLGIVTKIDSSNGSGYVYGSGRANATPNLLNGEVFFGEGNVSIQKPLSDILSGSSYVYSGSFSGSFEGDGSGLTGVGGIFTVSGSDVDNNQFDGEISVLQFDSSTGLNVSQSAEGTAFVSIGSHYRDIVINGQTTLVAEGSDQLELIAGDGIDLTTSTSDTNANSVSKEINFSVDSTVLRTTGDSVVSSSTQIDHDQTTNYSADEHFTQGSITTVGTVTSGDISGILPNGTISSSAQVNADSITNFDTNVKDKMNTDGVISSSIQIDHDQTTNFSSDEHFTQANITTVGTVTSGDVSGILPSGVVSGSDQLTNTFLEITGDSVVSSSEQVSYTGLSNIPSGIVSGSSQVSYTGLSNIPSGIVSSSAQIDHDQTTNYSSDEHFTQGDITTVGTVTSGDISGILPSGTVSSSAQVSYTGLSNVPSGIISSSAQVNADNVTNFDTNVKDKMNTDGVISSSAQVDHDSTTNYSADEHFTQGDITTVGTVTSGDVSAILPSGVVSGSTQLTNTFLEITGDSVISSSAEGDGQGQIKLNGVNVNTNGLGTDDSPTFSGLTIDTDTLYVDSTNNNVGIGNLTPSGSLHIGDNNGTRRIILHGANSQTTSSEIIFGDSKGGAVPNITYAGMGMRYDSQNNILSIRRFWDGGAEVDESFVNFDRDSKLTTFTDDVVVSGDLTVNGTTTTVNSTEVEIGDRIIVLNGQDAAGDSGINVYDTSTNQTGSLLWDSSGDYWKGGELGSEVKFLRQTGDSVVSSSAQISHDSTTGFVSNEHIDHSGVSITAGNGLTGGGTIESTRALNVGAGDGISVAADSVAVDATVLRTTGDSVVSSSAQISHDSTTGFVSNEHIDHSSVTLTAGDGLSGGGDITTNRSFAVDSTVVRTSGDQTIGGTKTFSSNIVGSGNLDVSGNVQFSEALLAFTENTDVDTGTEVISSLSTSTYEGGFFDVIIKNGTNVRASQVMIVHDGTSVVMSETSTTDLGDTSDLTLEADVSGGTFRLKATATSDNWSVRTVVRAF